jgi:hypothetical protein
MPRTKKTPEGYLTHATKLKWVDDKSDVYTGMTYGTTYDVVSEDKTGYFVTNNRGQKLWFRKEKFEVLEVAEATEEATEEATA